MIAVQRELDKAQCKSRILLQVHDELVLEVTEDEKEQVAQLVRTAMEGAASLDIPLLADVNCGRDGRKQNNGYFTERGEDLCRKCLRWSRCAKHLRLI